MSGGAPTHARQRTVYLDLREIHSITADTLYLRCSRYREGAAVPQAHPEDACLKGETEVATRASPSLSSCGAGVAEEPERRVDCGRVNEK